MDKIEAIGLSTIKEKRSERCCYELTIGDKRENIQTDTVLLGPLRYFCEARATIRVEDISYIFYQ
jgi:hypothetical protein